MDKLLATLTSETLQIVTYFCIGMSVAGIIASIWSVWSREIGVSWSNLVNLWSAWVVVMASGLAVVFMAVATGLLATGIVRAIDYAIDVATLDPSYTSNTPKPFESSSDSSFITFLLLIGMIAIAASIFAALAGVVQWAYLREVIDRPVARWVKGNMQAWTLGIVASLVVAALMGQLVGLWGFNGVLLLGGIITGGSVGEKVMSAGVEMMMHERYERSQGNDEAAPQAPKVIPLVASALVVIPFLLIVTFLALRAATTLTERPSTPRRIVARTIVEVPTVEPTPTPTPTVISMPSIPAATFCDGVERMHPSDTYVCVGSETGDPVGAGGNWVMTAESSDFESIRANSYEVLVRFYDSSNSLTLRFAAPLDRLLTPGTYEIASNATETYFARLEVTSNHHRRVSCVGRFEVLVYEHDGGADVAAGNVNITRFAADFEQECDSSHATLYGTIRINIPVDDTE